MDIGTERATCTILSRSGKNIEFQKSWEVDFAAEGLPADLLRESLARECPTPPDAIAASLPSTKVSHRILHLPFRETAKLQATIPFEIESEVPFDIENSVVAWMLLSEASHSATVLAAVARNEDIASHLEFLAEAGIDPALVTLGTLATAELLGSEPGPTLLLDIRADGGLVVLEDGEIRKLHGIGTSDNTGLQEELNWAIAAYRNLQPERVLLAEIEQSSKLALPEDLPTQPLRDFGAPWIQEVPDAALRSAALAKAATEPSHRCLNFRTGPFVYHAPSEEAHRQLRRTGWLAAATLLVLLGTWFMMFVERRTELTELRSEIAAQTRAIVTKAPRGTEVRRVRAALEQLEKKRTLLGGSNQGAPTLDRLLAIHAAIPAKVPLEVADLTLDPSGVRFRGRTDTFESVDIVSSALASLPEFSAANVQDVKAGVDGRIEFRATLETEGGS